MIKLLSLIAGFTSLVAAADPRLLNVEADGEADARLVFRTDGAPKDVPKISIKDNVIELQFTAVALAEEGKKIDVPTPHVLVNRVSVFEPEKGKVKARIVVNGSIDRLKDRVKLTRTDTGITLMLSPPEGENPTLSLLKEEQVPLAKEASGAVVPKGPGRWAETLIPVLLLTLLLAAGAGGYQYLRKKGKLGGTRKYLVEHVSYCPVGQGAKAGVSLIRVGPDFFLIGVTSGQVNLLSPMPQLGTQYKEETRLERESFQEAVETEVKRLRGREHTA